MYFIKNKLTIYTFVAIVFKCILFTGFMLAPDHTRSVLFQAFYAVRPFLIFQCAFILLFLSFGFLMKNRYRLWFLVSFNLMVSILFLIDLWYLRGFNAMPSLLLFKQTANLNGLAGSILSLIKAFDFIFIADLLVLIPLVIANKKLYKDAKHNPITFSVMLLVSLCTVLYIPIKVNIFGIEDGRIYYFRILNPNTTARGLSPIGYHTVDAVSFVKDSRPLKLSEFEKQKLQAWFSKKYSHISDNRYKSIFQGKNLILIQVESLENFIIGQEIDSQQITPNINSLLRNSLYFSNFHEQVGHGTTSDAELMATTSVYPLRQGSTFFRFPYTTYNSLPKLLEGKGYSTIAMHGDEGSFWNWVTAFTSIGFDKCIDSSLLDKSEVIDMGISDASFLRQAEKIMLQQKQPFFSYLITLTSHGPFNLPKEQRELNLDDELDKSTLGGYFQSLHYVDKHIGILIDRLKKDGLLDNTVIALYGDHEGVHKYYPADIKKLSVQQSWWEKNNKEVPFIIFNKGLQGEEIKTIGGQIDILPTLAYLFGVDEESYTSTSMGRNLLKTDRSFVVLNSGEYIGENSSEEDIENAVEGLELADKIIKSDYFKEKK